MPVIQVGPQPVKVVDVDDPEGVVFNRSITTQVFWGPSASQANRADASILDPNATLAVNDRAQVWMSTGPNGPTISVDYHPNSVAFFREITSGQGSVAIPSIHSPNFLHNVSGWTVNNDGSVEFNNGLFRGTLSASVFQGTNFLINSTGEFYYNASGPGPNNLIASNTPAGGSDGNGNIALAGLVSYFMIAANSFVALQVFGGVLQGYTATTEAGPWTSAGDIVFSNSPSGYQISTQSTSLSLSASGVAGASTNAISITSTGTGSIQIQVANNAGLTINANGLLQLSTASTGQPIQFFTFAEFVAYGLLVGQASAPTNSIAGALFYADVNQNMRYVANGGDGNNYAVGKKTVDTTATITINSLSDILIAQIPNMLAGVKYRVRAQIVFLENQAAGQAVIGFNGAVILSEIIGRSWWTFGSGPVNPQVYNGSLVASTSPVMTGATHNYEFEGFIIASTSGSFNIRGHCTIAADTWQVAKGSYLEVEPVG